jgi:uncharacterized membrane protein
VSTALEVTDKIYDETQPPKVKAYNRLSKYVLKIIKESLKDSKSKHDIDKKKIRQQIRESFDNASDRFQSVLLQVRSSHLPPICWRIVSIFTVSILEMMLLFTVTTRIP